MLNALLVGAPLPSGTASALTYGYLTYSFIIRASLLNTLWPSDRMWTPKVFRRSWGLATMMYGDLAMGVLSAVPWLESSRRVRHAELL